jgi:hypothetical protein
LGSDYGTINFYWEGDERLKGYNGFSGEQRVRAQSWLNAQWTSGAITRPLECIACGQMAQPIDAHAEDYSEPFRKDVTDAFHLCFICHMMVHCRHRSEEAWRVYRQMVESGGRAIPVGGRHFPAFQQKFLTGKILPGQFEWFDPPQRPALREIELSQDQAAKRVTARVA